MVTPRKFNETDEQYLARLAKGGALEGNGTLEILVTRKTALGAVLKAWIWVTEEGFVDTIANGRRAVMRLAPPPADDESIYGLIERVAKRCREVDEFGR